MSNDQIDVNAYAIPLEFRVFGQLIGDHTWVASNANFCEGCRFGQVPTPDPFYCHAGRWQNGVYAPPANGSRLLATKKVSRKAATCMIGQPYHFMGIPSQCEIVYAINGVCHTLSNRICYPSGLTVEGSRGYDFIRTIFGVYGTAVPLNLIPSHILVPFPPFWVPNPLAIAARVVQIAVWARWNDKKRECAPVKIADEGPEGPQDEFLQKVRALHEQSMSEATPKAWTKESYGAFLDKCYQVQMEEIQLSVDYKGQGIDKGKLKDHLQIWAEFHKPESGAVEAAFNADGFVCTQDHPDVELNEQDAHNIANFMNTKASSLRQRVLSVLGNDDYQKLYNDPADREILVIDPYILGGIEKSKE